MAAFQRKISEPIPARTFCHPTPRSKNKVQEDFVSISVADFKKSAEFALIISGTRQVMHNGICPMNSPFRLVLKKNIVLSWFLREVCVCETYGGKMYERGRATNT